MMQYNVPLLLSESAMDHAALVAREVGHGTDDAQLNSLGLGGLLGRIEEVWAKVEFVLYEASRYGLDKAKELCDDAVDSISALLEQAGQEAERVNAVMMEKLRVFGSELVKSALNLVPHDLVVGSSMYKLSEIGFGQKLMLSGKPEISLMKLAEFVASGEIGIDCKYAPTVADEQKM